MKISTLKITNILFVGLLCTAIASCAPRSSAPNVNGGNGGEAPNVTDENGLKQGVWRETDLSGRPTQGTYKDGQKHGLWKVYRKNGSLFQINDYFEGDLRKSTFYSHTDPSQATLEQMWKNGVLHGRYRTWTYDKVKLDYVLSMDGMYTNGKRTGTWLEVYYTAGILEETNDGVYTDGHRTGTWMVVDVTTGSEAPVEHTCTPPTDGSAPPENLGRVTSDPSRVTSDPRCTQQ